MNIVELSVKRPVMMTMVILFLIVMGLFSYFRIPIDMVPRIDLPIITVMTIYPGAGPKEVESQICKTIEDAVISINGIDSLRSDSSEGYGNVIIEFDDKVDVDTAAADVREKVSMIRSQLPDDAKAPVIMKLDINALPVITLAVSSKDRPVTSVYRIVDELIKDELSRAAGVASVDYIGAREREIQIRVRKEMLESYNLSILTLSSLIAQKSLNLPSGHITHSAREYTVRLDGEFDSVESIKNLEIPLPGGRKIALSEIAVVENSYEEFRQSLSMNGKTGIGVIIQKRSDANTTETAKAVKKILRKLKEKLPSDIQIDLIKDRSKFIDDSVNDLFDNLYMGILITAIILFLFLHNINGTLIASISIPVSIISAFSLIYFAGFTINMMTLMALAISVGILVNNAIIVIENIYVHLDHGKEVHQAAIDGTNEVMVPVMGATLTNVVVFVPIAFMEGIIGKFFYEFGLTVTFATFISLLVAFTMTPMLASRFLQAGVRKKNFIFKAWDSVFNWFQEEYSRILTFSLNHKFLVTSAAIILLIASFMLGPFIGFEFITEPDQHEFDVTIKRSPGTSLESTSKTLKEIEKILKKSPEVKMIVTKLGKTESMVGGTSSGTNIGEISVKLDSSTGVKTDAVIQRLYPDLAKLTDLEVNVKRTGMMGTTESPLQINIKGFDIKILTEIGQKITDKLKSIRGAADVANSIETGKPEIRIVPIREKLRLYGISEAYIAMSLRTYIEGIVSTVYRDGDEEYDIKVKMSGKFRNDIKFLKELSIVTPAGSRINISEIAKVEDVTGPSLIKRRDRSRMINVSGNVIGRSLGEVVNEMKEYIATLNLPLGYSITFAGQVERMEESFGSLLTAMALASIFTYMLLAALLESFIHPVTILISFPLAFMGILMGLFLTGMTISIFSLMAVVMLIGIVVNNGILMIEQIRLLRDRGEPLNEAVIEGCSSKLRPIIMTALSAVGAMVPLALGFGAGGEMRAPMAVVSIGGLIASTILSLVIIPITYFAVEKVKLWFAAKKQLKSEKV